MILTTQQKIQQRIGLTKVQFDRLIFNLFFNLLAELSRSPMHLQNMLLKQSINRWFLTELDKINEEFYKVTEPYEHLSQLELLYVYKNYVKRIYKFYPSALIDSVKVKYAVDYRTINVN